MGFIWILRRLDKREKKKITDAIEKEYKTTGRVYKSLSEDDRTIVDKYATEKKENPKWIDHPKQKDRKKVEEPTKIEKPAPTTKEEEKPTPAPKANNSSNKRRRRR